jgi:hypothetical protein
MDTSAAVPAPSPDAPIAYEAPAVESRESILGLLIKTPS